MSDVRVRMRVVLIATYSALCSASLSIPPSRRTNSVGLYVCWKWYSDKWCAAELAWRREELAGTSSEWFLATAFAGGLPSWTTVEIFACALHTHMHTHTFSLSHTYTQTHTHARAHTHGTQGAVSPMWISHVTHMPESWCTYTWVMVHTWIRHIARINVSYRTCKSVISHT